MGKLTAVSCETSKPKKDRDKFIGDGDGLFLRIRPAGTKAWVVECEYKGQGRNYTIGSYDPNGAPGASIEQWLRHRLSWTHPAAAKVSSVNNYPMGITPYSHNRSRARYLVRPMQGQMRPSTLTPYCR